MGIDVARVRAFSMKDRFAAKAGVVIDSAVPDRSTMYPRGSA